MLIKKKAIFVENSIKFIYCRISKEETFIVLSSQFWRIEKLQKKFTNWTYIFCIVKV